jgi:hypothetical protein
MLVGTRNPAMLGLPWPPANQIRDLPAAVTDKGGLLQHGGGNGHCQLLYAEHLAGEFLRQQKCVSVAPVTRVNNHRAHRSCASCSRL